MSGADWGALITAIVAFLGAVTGLIGAYTAHLKATAAQVSAAATANKLSNHLKDNASDAPQP